MVVLGKNNCSKLYFNSYHSLEEIGIFSVDRQTNRQTDQQTDRRTYRQTKLPIVTPTQSLKKSSDIVETKLRALHEILNVSGDISVKQ